MTLQKFVFRGYIVNVIIIFLKLLIVCCGSLYLSLIVGGPASELKEQNQFGSFRINDWEILTFSPVVFVFGGLL